MSELAQRLAGLSPAQRQLLEKRLAGGRPSAEPIAIIGMACRFPGAPSLAAYWRLIHEGIDAVGEIPASRWNVESFFDPTGEASGKMSVRWAALVDEPDLFDPQFFGITPREAARMDPQQRLLLEVAWEAMENAGRPADEMAGTRTGVFVGIGGTDYSKVAVPYSDYYQHIDAHMGTGNALSIAANRISYIFDFHGPSAALDTACSSSSLAIHFAVESLRRGESDAALAGGVNMILTPETTIAFSKARMLSPEGKCRPFDADANGYVRGEGCGLVLLKRLADAQRDGDRILALLRATSVNQDGRTSGISAPNSQSQVACIRAALAQAELSPESIGYIEAHGTGTPLGDPIEMQALCEIFTSAGDAPPCYVSSVKANVGHMETVSGVAGLIKVLLMLEHGDIPPQLHFRQLNPHIRLDGTRLAIPSEHVAWPAGDRPRLAGVSSFGFGGTNTHLIVEAAGEVASVAGDSPWRAGGSANPRPIHLSKLSAKTESALAREAEQLAAYCRDHPDADVADVCYSANTGRADFNHRATVVAANAAQLSERLDALAAGGRPAGVKQSSVRTLGRPQVAFLFTGQGLQYVGMGRGLYESQPVFRAALDRCDEILRGRWGGQSLLEILYPPDGAADSPDARLHQTEYTQPAMFALSVALADLWRSWGVVPDVVLGHSVGEYAAACAAGVMNLEDGLALIAERARLMQSVKRHGKMAVVFAPQQRVAQAISDCRGEVVIAVVNGPDNTVISGDASAVEQVAAQFADDRVQVKMLQVSHAFHSPLMDEMLDAFERFAAGLEFHPPQVALVSNLTGQVMADAPTAHYWRDHLRNTVQFAEGMQRVAEAEPSIVIELGPTASLLGMGRRCVPQLDAAWLPSLRQDQDDWQVLATSVAEYYVRGGHVDWRAWDRPWQRRRLQLPNYPFERTRHWFTLDPSLARSFDEFAGAAAAASGVSSGHPLLGTRLSTVWSNVLLETSFSEGAPSWLADHQVQGSPVTPAAAYVEQGLAAADQLFGSGCHGLADLVIQQAMFLPEGARRRVQVSIAPESGGQSSFETYSRPADEEPSGGAWTMHATGRIVHEGGSVDETHSDLVDLEAARAQAVSITSRDDFYALMAERGLAYGPAFQVLDDLHRGIDAAVARVSLPESVLREAGRYHLHPALGDALLQSMAGAVPLEEDGSFSPFTYMPVGVRRVRVARPIDDFAQPLFTYAVRTSDDSSPSPERVAGDVCLVNAAGEMLVAFEGIAVERLGRSAAKDSSDTSDWLYRVAWQPAPLEKEEGSGFRVQEPAVDDLNPESRTSNPVDGAWLIFADNQAVGRQLADRLAGAGQGAVLAEPGTEYRFSGNGRGNGRPGSRTTATLDPLDADHYRQLLDQAFTTPKRRCLGVVHLWSLDISEPGAAKSSTASEDAWQTARRHGCGSALELVRALVHTPFSSPPTVWFATSGAQAVDGVEAPRIAVAQSPLLGLVRVVALEHPELSPRLVDLDPAGVVDDAVNTIAAELTAEQTEGEIAYRDGRRYAARLMRDPSLAETSTGGDALSIPAGKSYQLRILKPGSLDALQFVPVRRQPPEPGQVEIEVRAAGLNFSDVLKGLGLYPGIRDQIVPLGIEASGVVTAVGPGVERFSVGDEVLGVVPYAFGSHARTAAYALVPKPAAIDHDEACTIPITFLTAYYALVHLARLQPGERVLIHAGAGGVGLAAIQIAQHIGAEVFATAGSDEKRDFLRSLGVQHVYNSRTLEFADEIRQATDRQGVDVVLNSLPGEAIPKSLSILRAYGRFLEIGKIDIYQNRMIGLSPFQDNLSYFAIDLDRMLRERPEYIRTLFGEVMEHFAAGHYRPLLFTRFAAGSTIDAFRYMSQRKNIGKVVVSMEGQESRESSAEGQEPEESGAGRANVRGDGSYLITGGLGALGLQVAGWLADEGAGTIALLSRRGSVPEVEGDLAALRDKGARVVVLQADVTDASSLETALEQLPQDGPPLRGVVHAAGILADGVLADMDLDQLDRAMRPKVQGAWNLHLATRHAPLDWFVMFSSVASVLGSPGQANYAAGNALLDALAHERRTQGLPATTINWGPWADSGMAAKGGRDEAVQSRGLRLMPPDKGLDLLGRLLQSHVPRAVVMDAQWSDLLRSLGSRRPTLLAEIAAEAEQAGGAVTSRVDHAFRNQLLEADKVTRHALTRDYIRDELARIMGVEPESLDADQPLSTFGLDSLLALELKTNLESRLDFTLPMAKLMEGPSITSLAQETARLVAGGGASDVAAGASEAWTPLLVLRPTGDRPPLVLLPALGGDVQCYAELVQQLDADQPVYAFRPRGVDEDLPPHRTMDDTMADYVAALRRLQPAGPYYVAGWSAGGIYAFALAEALEREGEAVALVALWDSPLPSICDNVDLEDDARFLCDLVNFANCFAGTKMRVDYNELSALAPSARFQAALAEARRKQTVFAEAPESYIRRLVHVGQANVQAVQSYQPRPLGLPVHLFVPTIKGGLAEIAGKDMPEELDHGWSRHVGQQVEVHEVAGDHFSMLLGEGAAQIARRLHALLGAATTPQPDRATDHPPQPVNPDAGTVAGPSR